MSGENRLVPSGIEAPKTVASAQPPDGPAATMANEVEFALVLARMIDSVKNDPHQLRSAIYELARHKLEEQFTRANSGEVQRTKNALEVAIRGVEVFFKKDDRRDHSLLQQSQPEPPVASLNSESRRSSYSQLTGSATRESEVTSTPSRSSKQLTTFSSVFRFAILVVVVSFVSVGVQQRTKLLALFQYGKVEDASSTSVIVKIPGPSPDPAVPQSAGVKPLLPTSYGVYALSDGKLFELKLLPGRAPDMRVAISAAIGTPSQTILPNPQIKFIVFRRESGPNGPDRAEIRIIAKVPRTMSYEAGGKPNVSDEEKWVIRNISFPYRMAPLKGHPDMDEITSEDPDAELSPGRYALVLKGVAYDFSIAGALNDPRHCLERLTASNGTFYSQCSLRPSIKN